MKGKTRLTKHSNHLLNGLLDLDEVVDLSVDLSVLLVHVASGDFEVSLDLVDLLLLLVFRVLHHILVLLDLSLDSLVLLFNGINLRVELVDVVIERIVLFFSLDESSDNLINGGDASLLSNLFEGILDDLNVPDVLVHQLLLLFIVLLPLKEPLLQHFSRVGELFSILHLDLGRSII